MKSKFSLLLIALSIATAIGFFLAVSDNNSGIISLSIATPIIKLSSSLGAPFATKPLPWLGYSVCTIIFVLLALLTTPAQKGSRYFLLALVLAILGQYLFVDRYFTSYLYKALGFGKLAPNSTHLVDSSIGIPAAVILYILSAITFVFGFRSSKQSTDSKILVRTPWHFNNIDAFIFGAVFILALIHRLYALNLISEFFEGEISPYSAGATSLSGMIYANRGTNGPWSPLGFLYYLPIYFTTSIFSVDLLSLRLSSVLVGLATLPLIFVLAHRLGGRITAHVATAFFAFNCLHLGWHRSDIYPHGAMTWPTLLLCWCLLKAYDTKKMIWALGVALMMGLTWHQYPSGQSAVVIPPVALGLFCLFNRFSWSMSKKQTVLIAFGVGLWILGLPASYYLADGTFIFRNPFTLTGSRASWGDPNVANSVFSSLLHVVLLALSQTWDVIQGIFFKQPYFFHQEWVPYFDLIQARTVAWLEVPFLFIGTLTLLRFAKKFESCVLFAFLFAAILPGVLSEHAYPKRLSTFYPALDIIAGIGLVAILNHIRLSSWYVKTFVTTSITLGFAVFFCFLSNVWFSGRFWKMREPAEIAISQDIARSITPGTIVLGSLTREYDAGKYLYLLLDHLASPTNRPNAWLPNYTPRVAHDIEHPLEALNTIASTWPYLWTKLDKQVEEISTYRDWQKIVFIFQTNAKAEPYQPELASLAMSRCATPIHRTIAPKGSAQSGLLLIECHVNDHKNLSTQQQ